MGLDLVEMVLEVEDEFNIYIPDRDLEQVATPDDLATYIFEAFKDNDKDKCSTQIAFYQLRKLLIIHYGFSKKELRPTSNLQDLFAKDIRLKWSKLQELLDNRLPILQLSREENQYIFYFFLALSLPLYYYLNDLFLVFATVLMGHLVLWLFLTRYFSETVPKGYQKLSSLLRFIEGNTISKCYNTKEKVLEKVIEISSEQFGIPINQIKPNSRLIEDLNVD